MAGFGKSEKKIFGIFFIIIFFVFYVGKIEVINYANFLKVIFVDALLESKIK